MDAQTPFECIVSCASPSHTQNEKYLLRFSMTAYHTSSWLQSVVRLLHYGTDCILVDCELIEFHIQLGHVIFILL